MIQQLMIYAVMVAAVLSLAGWGLERLATLRGRPRRTAWIAALVLSVLLPLIMILRAEPPLAPLPVLVPATEHEPVIIADVPAPRSADRVFPASQPMAQQPIRPPREWHLPQLSDRSLLQAWAIASLLSGLYLLGANLRLRRRISGWQRATLLGRPVLISEAMGPAIVGVFRPRMVIPRWLLDEPLTTQALILEHEGQHIAAYDPLLIRAAVVLLAALPWNLPLWWQWRRMRQAIELDCDARVLRAGAQAQAYGEVLLAVTGRATRMPSAVVAMSEPVSALERRIQNLLPDPVRHAALQAAGALALLVVGVGIAVAMDAPAIPGRVPLQTMSASRPVAIEATPQTAPPPVPVPAAAAAATPAAPAARTDSAQPGRTAPATATPEDGELSPRDKALRAAVQQYPELINGPALPGYYYLTIVVRADGTLYRSSLRPPLPSQAPSPAGVDPATHGSGALAGVVNHVLNSRFGHTLPAFDKVNEGPQTAKIPKGQQIADVGTASNDIEALWRVLPADYDESRDSRRVTDVVLAKHDDLMLPSSFQSPMPNINLLTVFMTEDGQIAREAVQLLDNTQYESLNPRPVTAGAIVDAGGGPYTSYNPPPVPVEAFEVLGLDAGQIGQTGFLLVMRSLMYPQPLRSMPIPADQLRELSLPHYVLVRYAWPRRPGEPIGGKAPTNASP